MAPTYIDFDLSTDLTKAVLWVYDPDKELTPSCALRHVYLKQISATQCAVLGYAPGETWLYRLCPAQGIIGQEFLFDAEDLLTRIGKKDGFKDTSMRISATKETKMNVEAVMRIVDNKVESAGNIMIPTYGGELSDFELPSEDWKLLTVIADGWDYFYNCRYINFFSALKSATQRQAVWFRFQDNALSISSTERGGDRGNTMINCEMNCISPNFRFGIPGRYLLKTAETFGVNQSINIYVDDLTEPTRVKFEGEMGAITLPLMEEYHCQALSLGAMSFFYGEGEDQLNEICDRTFNLPQLSKGVDIQSKKATSNRKDRLLEMIDEKLIITKRSDSLKKELSEIPTWTLNGKGNWVSLVVDHDYLEIALDTLDKHCTQVIKNLNSNPIQDYSTEWDDNEDELFLGPDDEENRKQMLKYKLACLTQKKCEYGDGLDQWFLFIESPDHKGCRMLIICSSVESTADIPEDD